MPCSRPFSSRGFRKSLICSILGNIPYDINHFICDLSLLNCFHLQSEDEDSFTDLDQDDSDEDMDWEDEEDEE